MLSGNLFKSIADILPSELFETLLHTAHVHIERIVSQGHITPEGEWYDQAWDEWVVLLQGQAILKYQFESSERVLNPGDYVLIPAHCKHRVEWTLPGENTVWLAIHLLP